MCNKKKHINRRNFLGSTVAMGAIGVLSKPEILLSSGDEKKNIPSPEVSASPRYEKKNIKLGFDNFSVRAFGWKAPKLIEYAASLKVNTLLLSDLDVYESLEDDYLKKIRAKAEGLGIEIQVGTGSICPTSETYNQKKWGKAEDHLRLLIRTARRLGTGVARCYMGHSGDRRGDGGINRHIEATLKVCKAVKSEALDAGVKIAIENHAGDTQAWELAGLIEAAGKDYVGATMDCGNAAWTMEDPMVNLEILGPYAVTTGLRDNAIWETEKGASVMWVNMGEGVMDWNQYLKRFRRLCPKVPFVLEIISYKWQSDLNYLEPGFWKVFPRARASEFARFIALAKRGKKYTIPSGRPDGKNSQKLEQAKQKYDLEKSIKYCKEILGLGV